MAQLKFANLLVAALCGFGLAGCSSSSTGESPGPAATTAAQACTDMSAAFCAKLASCGSALLRLRYGDEATCENGQTASCLAALAAPGTGNSPDATEACVAAYADYACADFQANTPPSACRHPGTGTSGEACAFAGQCQSDYCAVPEGAMCGTCAAQPAEGDSCATLSGCGYGQYCTEQTEVCAQLGSQGASCNRDRLCAYGLGCAGATPTADGTCQPVAKTEGAGCGGASGPACDRANGLGCVQGACRVATYAGSGAECGAVSSTNFVLCEAGAQCELATGQAKGTCMGGAADGATCDNANQSPCVAPNSCIGPAGGGSDASGQGTCQVPTAAGCG